MNVLIDLNVILDVVLQRQPWLVEATAVWNAHHNGQIRGHIVATSLTNLFYIVRRILGRDDALRAVLVCLQTYAIVGVDEQLLKQAAALSGLDLEDNVQVAGAVIHSLDAIVTREISGFAASPVLALSPGDLLARLAGKTP